MDIEEICKEPLPENLDQIVYKLGTLLKIVKSGAESTHAVTKEIRRVLESIIEYDEDIDVSKVFSEALVPLEVYSPKMRKCYVDLVKKLVEKVIETTKNLSIGSKIKLINIIIKAIDNIAEA